MKKARTNTYSTYRIATFDGKAECYISCHPQQRWNFADDGEAVILRRANIRLIIPKNDFERNWKVVE